MCYDSDILTKEGVWLAARDLGEWLKVSRSADLRYVLLPRGEDGKTGLDDYLVAGHSAEQLWGLVTDVRPDRPAAPEAEESKPEPITDRVMSLDQAHKVFRKWLGLNYDADALNAALAAAAVGRMTGDPLWLLVIGGSGNAKTETVQAVAFGAGAVMTSTLSSEAALLSGTLDKDKASDATGGLLRLVGEQGLLVIKDFTSIITANSRLRGDILSALREIYDGHWYRDVGGERGRRLWWKGRLAVIAACTTAWDRHHEVVTMMGDRFVIIRMDSSDKDARREASEQAIDNTRREEEMRAALAEAAGAVLNGMRDKIAPLTKREIGVITDAADLVTRARTAVDYDYSGNVIDSHALEMPTRFAKQLAQVVFGGQAIGLSRREAIKLAIRCARDSVPPLRLAIIRDLENHPDSAAGDVRKRLDKPYVTVKRQLDSLHLLGVCTAKEADEYSQRGRRTVARYYGLADHINPAALTSPEKLLQGASGASSSAKGQKRAAAAEQETAQTESPGQPSNKSGNDLPLILICEICLQPMTVVEDGQTTHPNCDEKDRIPRGPYFACADLDEYRRRRDERRRTA